MTSDQKIITLEDLFQLPYTYLGHLAHEQWRDLLYNRKGWHGWTSWLEGFTHADVKRLATDFFNRHAYIQMSQQHVYTQMPIRNFFFARQIEPTLYIRGAVWSNGAIWEELMQGHDRHITLAMDTLTMKTFEYPTPNYDDDERLADFRSFKAS